MNAIKVQIKNVYGAETVYPACPKAVLFAKLAGTKTLTDATLKIIADLGYDIAVDQPSVLRSRSVRPMDDFNYVGSPQHY